ncbi:MAG TPA: GNAT family N-acetyltransferase [Nocardioidaceae bacterium]|nr:GNAT family N-acetyltransferase [Nocardioidaceae bacterium]
MQVQQLDPQAVDAATAAAIVALRDDVRRHDAPHEPPLTLTGWQRMMRYGWDGTPPALLWVAYRNDEPAGYAELWLPKYDNHHLAGIQAATAPAHRGRGIGTALLDELLRAARQAGRTLALGEAWQDSAGDAFLEARGFEWAATEEQRRLELVDLDRTRVDAMYDGAAAAARDYELVPLVGAAPADMVDGLVEMVASINDAPTENLHVDDFAFDAARLMAVDEAQTAMGRRMYRLLARHIPTGEWAGHTVMEVDDDQPEWGIQDDTSVVRAHRGHRLGLLLKTGMLRWLQEVEPQLERIDTWNNASNRHMIAVNDALGCVVVGRVSGRQRQLGG